MLLTIIITEKTNLIKGGKKKILRLMRTNNSKIDKAERRKSRPERDATLVTVGFSPRKDRHTHPLSL